MVNSLKSNDNQMDSKTCLPLPPAESARTEMEIYARFMRHLRMVPNSEMDIKILSAIQFTADLLDIGDALVAKTLVDQGLRAPRKAYPASYLEFIDRSLMRTGWDVGGPTVSAAALKQHWDLIGEDKFAAVRHVDTQLPLPSETIFVET